MAPANSTAYAQDTWIEAEELAYPSGSITAGRRARAICPDGVARIARIGVPDTFFTIPARVQVKGKTLSGFISISTTEDDEQVVTFTPRSRS